MPVSSCDKPVIGSCAMTNCLVFLFLIVMLNLRIGSRKLIANASIDCLILSTTGATQYFDQSKEHMALNAIHVLFSSLTANMANILINFQQKFAVVRTFPLNF